MVALCRRFRVSSLDVFGSADTPRFDPHCSDIDFVVEFSSLPGAGRANAYFGLHEASFIAGQTVESYVGNEMLRSPVERQYKIFSETLSVSVDWIPTLRRPRCLTAES